jgi:PadR family transcriptional regulator PadR
MESQFRRGILEACVLAVLEKGESYGYQLVKDVNDFIEISESTMYPILRRLEQTELLEVFSMEHNGRLRKYYRITDKGREKITEMLEEWAEIVKIYQFIVKEREEKNE